VGYQSAGTVEFVVGKDQGFYFLEMNTRLQVEHPVTECITGLDLVEWMIRIAADEKLPLQQSDLKREGWAIECRINAEDPFRNFLPSTGRLVRYQPPPTDLTQGQPSMELGVRVDTGVFEGGEIPMHYDSMIAKLIVHGKDRADAINRMREALNGFVIRGIASNIPFQAALLAHPDFQSGNFDTGFIARQWPSGFKAESVTHDDPDFLVALAAFVRRKTRERAVGISGQLPGHEVGLDNKAVAITHLGEGNSLRQHVRVTEIAGRPGVARIEVDGRSYDIECHSRLLDVRLTGSVNGRPFVAQVERGTAKNPLAFRLQHNGKSAEITVLRPRHAELQSLMPYKAPPDTSAFLLSPMPGLLVQLGVAVGQKVQAGERLAVIEAMKMENVLFATQDVTVAEVLAKPGESLSVDQPILRFAR